MHWARLSLLVCLLYPCMALAQRGDVPLDKQIQITDVRVGFPAAGFDMYKEGKWVPVIVTIGPHKDIPNLQQNFTGVIQVETKDSDGWNTRILKDNIVVNSKDNRGTFTSYIKVSDSTSFNGIVVRLRGKYGTTDINQQFSYPPIDRQRTTARASVDHDQLFVVNIGSSHGIRAVEDNTNTDEGNYNNRGNPKLMAVIGASPNQLFELPDRWYGYESVDAVVIATGGNFGNSLAQKLANDTVRREALEQWVLQGGHLVITVADNCNIVGNATSFPLEKLLPVKIDVGAEKASRLDGLRDFIVQGVPQNLRKARGEIRAPSMPRARLDAKLGVQAMTASVASDAGSFKRPLIVRSAYGLGKITVVGLDTNTESFNLWENKTDFWSAVFEARTITPLANQYYGQQRDDASLGIANKIEEFGDVPVISFAVVAMFIALYILLIGPVDYFVLKKVFKRLEYTWITFPTVVLLVSLAAYFGAYYIKGDKLRINKVDLIDVDQGRERVMGTSWLAVFSPRLQNYNVDLEPQGVTSGAPTMSWLGRFSSYGGARMVGQSNSGLFERDYDYTPGAEGLRQLPIQVWSQKSLEARWLGTLDRAKLPIESKLVRERLYIKGSLKSKLPGKLLGAKLFYSDKVWNLGDLEPDKDVNIEFISQGSSGVMSNNVFNKHLQVSQGNAQQPDFSGDISNLVFQNRSTDSNIKGSEFLRYLNQSWRLKDYGEAVLVGTLVDNYGDAVQLNQGGSIGTKLKLTSPSGDNLLTGTMRHAAYLRVFIPVKEGTATPQ